MGLKTVKLLNFDLAKGVAGWSVLQYTPDIHKILVLKVGNITPTRVSSKVAFRDQVEKYGKDVITFEILDMEVTKLIKQHNPDFVTAEDAYYKEHLSAYTSLILCLHVVTRIAKQFTHFLYRIVPTKHKSALTSNGHCKKETTIETVRTHPNIDFLSEEDKVNLDEHQADSISVGHAFCLLIYPNITEIEKK